MYEEMTYEVIMQSLLDRVPDSVDKREGSIVYDALAPAAAELAQGYINLDIVLNETYADTATGIYLDKRCREKGISRQQASCAVVEGMFTPIDIDVTGKRFRSGDFYYIALDGSKLVCETAGSEPNGVLGQLIPIDYIDGLQTAAISKILIPGEDEESDDSLRKKYFDSISSQAYGGNKADYVKKVNEIEGVGGVKVTPVWNGGGTVLLTIVASDYTVPTSTLLEDVQEVIDPVESRGKGTGLAPIGHVVTVVGAVGKEILIDAKITYQSGWNWSSAGEYIEKAVDEYFVSLAESWDETDNIVVRISGIEQKILACAGVLDIQNTLLNGLASNIQLESNEIPKRGAITNGT